MSGHWNEMALGEVLELKRGYDLPHQAREPGWVPVVSSSGPTGFHSEAKVRAPGVVTGRYGTIGQVFLITEDFWPLNTTLYVRDFKGNDPSFVSYLLRTVDFRSCSDKAAVPGVNRNHLHQLKVRLPGPSTQRTIANILATLDDKIELNRRTNETLEAMARALFKSWFVDFDPVHAKKAGRKPKGMDAATAALFPDDFEQSALGVIPRGWNCTRLDTFVSLQRGTTYKSALLGAGGPVLLGLATIKRNGGFRSDSLRRYSGESPPKLIVKAGELYVSLKDVTQSADLLGAVARVPRTVAGGRVTQDTVKLVFDREPMPVEYIYRLLLTDNYREYCRGRAIGTTNLALSRDDFLSFRCAVPPFAKLSRLIATIAALSERTEFAGETHTLTCLRDALLPKLLSGELRVPEAERIVGRAV